MNISEIKKELQDLGISTSTPGLTGDERYEELKFRLDNAQRKVTNELQREKKEESSNLEGMDFTLLTIGELRSRLSSLGISTNTPGLSGQERWTALKQRLVDAICIRSEEEEEEEEEENIKLVSPLRVPPQDVPATLENRRPPPTSPPDETYKDLVREEQPNMVVEEDEDVEDGQLKHLNKVAQSEISELKRQIKRISNKRSLYIASKFSGSSQDHVLRQLSTELNEIEQDSNRLKSMEERGEKIVKLKFLKTKLELPSSNSSSTNEFLEISKINRYLEALKLDIKEKIKDKRQEIREQGENDPEFGIAVEERLNQQINDAILTNTKVSRTRKKFADVKEMDQTFHSNNGDISPNDHKKPEEKPIKKAPPSFKEESDVTLDGYNFPTTKADQKREKLLPSKESKAYESTAKVNAENNHSLESLGFRSDFLGKDILLSVSGSKDYEEISPSVNGKNKQQKGMKSDLDYFLDENSKKSLFTLQSKSTSEAGSILSEDNLPRRDVKPVIIHEKESLSGPNVMNETNSFPVADNPFLQLKQQFQRGDSENTSNGSTNRVFSSAGTIIVDVAEGEIEEVFRNSSPRKSPTSRASRTPLSTIPVGNDEEEDDEGEDGEDTKRSEDDSTPGPLQEKTIFGQPPQLQIPAMSSTSMPLSSLRSSSNDERYQIKQMRKYAKQLEKQDDNQAAEVLYQRALEMDPTDIMTLQLFAIFLHQKKGELSRAEAFFNRALQICMPDIQLKLSTPKKRRMLMQQSYRQLFHRALTTASCDLDDPSQDQNKLPTIISPNTAIKKNEARVEKIMTNMPERAENLNKRHSFPPLSSNTAMSVGFRLNDVIYLLLSFANFMLKSKGDIESSFLLLEKAVLLAPTQAITLANYAHFLSEHHEEAESGSFNEDNLILTEEELGSRQNQEESNDPRRPHPPTTTPPPKRKKNKSNNRNGPSSTTTMVINERFEKIDEMFRQALKYQPGNTIHMMWYGKFLKKYSKIGPAELMYKSAMECSKGNPKLEPTTICNYATFLLKKRKNYAKAEELFIDGLERFPNHKGLRKNFGQLIKILEEKNAREERRKWREAEKLAAIEREQKRKDEKNRSKDENDEGGSEESEEDDEDESEEDDDDDEDEEEEEEEEAPPRRNTNKNRALSPPARKSSYSEQRLMVLPSSPDRQHRGSRRAQRVRESLVNKLPENLDQNNVELKADYILKMMREQKSFSK